MASAACSQGLEAVHVAEHEVPDPGAAALLETGHHVDQHQLGHLLRPGVLGDQDAGQPAHAGPDQHHRGDFRITVGLREGWEPEGRVYDVSEAVRSARAWMRRRVEAGQPALSGMFTRGEVTYAWPKDDGAVGSDREPVAIFTGEAVHAYLGGLPDAQIEAMLNELAGELGAALGQERLYVAFCDKTWILDCGEG